MWLLVLRILGIFVFDEINKCVMFKLCDFYLIFVVFVFCLELKVVSVVVKKELI